MIDMALEPNETKDIIIQFTSSINSGVGLRNGKLVIKLQGLIGKSVKASLPLYATVGAPKVVFDESCGV